MTYGLKVKFNNYDKVERFCHRKHIEFSVLKLNADYYKFIFQSTDDLDLIRDLL